MEVGRVVGDGPPYSNESNRSEGVLSCRRPSGKETIKLRSFDENPLLKNSPGQPPSSEQSNIVWNDKIILMNGLSRSILEELSFDKISDNRIPHICNFLRFAVLKKDHSFMAVDGPWEPVDGSDPFSGNNLLVKTALRDAKDVIQHDLQNSLNSSTASHRRQLSKAYD
ncbi:hypothetical protein VNO77_07975 [Canavalia gladiata]|uniref:DBC1/CARP1 catalytically inactive NUDIX hydrolase domain-containing protein n=1 Tax=Canavalia gladiata TaxID=3824 RepID=A0AAN9MBW2_CANGL